MFNNQYFDELFSVDVIADGQYAIQCKIKSMNATVKCLVPCWELSMDPITPKAGIDPLSQLATANNNGLIKFADFKSQLDQKLQFSQVLKLSMHSKQVTEKLKLKL